MAVAGTALIASLAFFLVSNFASWCNPKSLYGYHNNDLLKCYEMGLPFLRFTVMSDIVFSVSVFAVPSIRATSYFPVEKVATVTVEHHGDRS